MAILTDVCWFQFKFAIVVMGRQTYLPEDSEYTINLHDFMPHVVQGTQGNQPLHNPGRGGSMFKHAT